MISENYRHVLLDASALICLINSEKGSDFIEQYIGKFNISSINLAEVAKYFVDNQEQEIEIVKNNLNKLIDNTISFTEEIAYLSAEIINYTKRFGLSLGDRACIATGIVKQLPIITTDKVWANLDIPNANIILAR